MKNLRGNKTSGISLVALIVTIIVLIILTAAVIVTFMEGGIIEKAKEAVFKSDMRTYQEILAVKNAEKQIELATGNGEGGLYNATELAEIQEIIPEFKEEYKDLIAISNGEIVLGTRTDERYGKWLDDLGIGSGVISENSVVNKLKVGDYVAYSIPEGERKTYNITEKLGADATDWIWNNNGKEEITYQDIMWRVLKNNGTTVTLVSADPVEKIYLWGENGFTKGPGILDEICSEVYGGRNIKIEDVNELLKNDREWGEDETNWMYYGTDFSTYNVPEGVRTIADLESSGAAGVITLDSREVPEAGKELGEYAPNYYRYQKSSLTDTEVATEIEKELIFRGSNYWLSSTCVLASFADYFHCFGVRCVHDNMVWSFDMFFSNGENYEEALGCGLRPVVTLSSSIQVVDEEAGGDTLDTAWELK